MRKLILNPLKLLVLTIAAGALGFLFTLWLMRMLSKPDILRIQIIHTS